MIHFIENHITLEATAPSTFPVPISLPEPERMSVGINPSPSLLLSLLLLPLLLHGVVVVGGEGGGGFRPLIRMPHSPSSSSSRRERVVSVDDFGAKGNGCTDDTKAFSDAWKLACSSPSVTALEIPAGNVYLIRPIEFAGPCVSKLTLQVLGTVIAPSDPRIWDGLDSQKWLYFHGVKNLAVIGGGTIDGMGQEWWARSCKRNATNPCRHAPTAITFHRAKHLRIQGLTLMNSQQMHIAFTRCSHVQASHLKVFAPAGSPNTDGIHISNCTSVKVEESMIRTGDDCISVVSNSSTVHIRNIVCGSGHGISIGSLGKSNSWDQVHNVQVNGAFISNSENGVRIKTWQGGRGYASNIIFRNIIMKNVSNPIIIDQYYCDSKRPCQNQTSAVKLANISFIGIKGTSATEHAVRFICSDTFPCQDILMKDIKLSLESGGSPTAYCWKAFGLSFGVVYPRSCLSRTDGLIAENQNVIPTLHSIAR